MDAAALAALRRQARALARHPADAEDLLQDALLAAHLAGRDDPRWLGGVLRNLAKAQARGAVRRRAREAVAAADESAHDDHDDTVLPALPALPKAARRVARFALHGLDGDEIRWLLGATPAALRQRTAVIRRALDALPAPQRAAWARAIERHRPPRAPGRLRRTLKAAIGTAPGLASHDPDGHPLVLRNTAHAWAPRGNSVASIPEE